MPVASPVRQQPEIARTQPIARTTLSHHHFSPYAEDSRLSAALLLRTAEPVYGQAATNIVTGKTIIITGAGGSIGSEIACQLLRIDPDVRLHFIDNDEYALYKLQLKLTSEALLNSAQYILGDILDYTKMRNVFQAIKPDIVFHAAAHKHLPLLERSPEAAVMTNIRGTHIIAEAAASAGAAHFINISTDKAAHPISVLGLTKRLAEMAAANVANGVTKVSSVRFGNVLGSRGSFLETLAYQVSNGRTVTITDPGMSRYFMTIPEAAGLVIEATALAEVGKIYVLDMGEPIQITDLVERYVRLTNSAPPAVRFTGIRPGEKLHEELVDTTEVLHKTAHGRIFSVDAPAHRLSSDQLQRICDIASSCPPAARLKGDLEELVYGAKTPAATRPERTLLPTPRVVQRAETSRGTLAQGSATPTAELVSWSGVERRRWSRGCWSVSGGRAGHRA